MRGEKTSCVPVLQTVPVPLLLMSASISRFELDAERSNAASLEKTQTPEPTATQPEYLSLMRRRSCQGLTEKE
jgi:hypothetical protein